LDGRVEGCSLALRGREGVEEIHERVADTGSDGRGIRVVRCVVETRVNGVNLSEFPVGGDELGFRFLRALDCSRRS
jgi:hypothetical protein